MRALKSKAIDFQESIFIFRTMSSLRYHLDAERTDPEATIRVLNLVLVFNANMRDTYTKTYMDGIR